MTWNTILTCCARLYHETSERLKARSHVNMAKVLEALNSLVDSGEVLALEYLDQLEVPLLVNSAALTGSKNESNNSHIGEEDFLPVSYFAHQSRKLEETGGIVWDASFVLGLRSNFRIIQMFSLVLSRFKPITS